MSNILHNLDVEAYQKGIAFIKNVEKYQNEAGKYSLVIEKQANANSYLAFYA